jgi:hypothetical protein
MWVNCCVRLLRAAVAMLACCNVGLCCMCVWWLLAGSCMSFGLCNSNLLQELVWLLIGCSHALLVYPHRGVLFRAGAQGALLSKSQIEKTGTLSYVDRLRSRRWHVYFHRWSTRSGWLRTLFFCVTHRSPYWRYFKSPCCGPFVWRDTQVRWSESSLHLVSKTRSLHLRNVIRKLCPRAAHSAGRALMQNTTPQTCIVSRIVHCILETCSRDLKANQRKYSFHHVVVAHKTPQVGIPTLPPRAYYLHCRSFFCHHILCCRDTRSTYSRQTWY